MSETTRTTAGYKMGQELSGKMGADAAMDAIRARVQVRGERIGYDTARIFTSTDGSEWVDEGIYVVQPAPGAVAPELDDEEDEPFDDDLARRLGGA